MCTDLVLWFERNNAASDGDGEVAIHAMLLLVLMVILALLVMMMILALLVLMMILALLVLVMIFALLVV